MATYKRIDPDGDESGVMKVDEYEATKRYKAEARKQGEAVARQRTAEARNDIGNRVKDAARQEVNKATKQPPSTTTTKGTQARSNAVKKSANVVRTPPAETGTWQTVSPDGLESPDQAYWEAEKAAAEGRAGYSDTYTPPSSRTPEAYGYAEGTRMMDMSTEDLRRLLYNEDPILKV